MTIKAFTGPRIFNGTAFLDDHAVLVADGKIRDVVPCASLSRDMPSVELSGGLLVPGFVDVQVNGGGGILFNDSPDPQSLIGMAKAHARYGTTAMLPTYITDRPEGMSAAIAAAKQVMGQVSIVGLHLEGPFLSKTRKGAHDAQLIRSLDDSDVDMLLDSGIENLLLTVAAENASPRLIERLSKGGVTVSLGHSDADFDVAMAAADAGARGVTHLFNAMSQLQHRQPGLVGAALEHGGLWCGIIPDGHHVHASALRIALRAKSAPGRIFMVTDAMPTAGHDNDTFYLNGRKVTRQAGVLRLEDGTLAGSDLTMEQAVTYVTEHLEVPLAEALRMASLYPAQFMRMDAKKGRLAKGYDADFVHLGTGLKVLATFIAGAVVS